MAALLIVFVLILTSLVGLLHWYLWVRLVRDTTRRGFVPRRVGTVATIVLAVLVPVTLVSSRALSPRDAAWLAWPGYVWLALFFYLLVALLLLEIPRVIAMRAARTRERAATAPRPAEHPPVTVPAAASATGAGTAATTGTTDGGGSAATTGTTDGGGSAATTGTADHAAAAGAAATTAPTDAAVTTADPAATTPAALSRRLFIGRTTAVVAGIAAGGMVGYGATKALGSPRILDVPVALRRLPAAADGLRIAVVSDIHLGPLRGRSHTERIVRLINEQDVDLVTIVGDMVDGSVEELGDAAAPLRDLVSRHGAFFVTGNHEYYAGADQWLREVERLGVRPLTNDRVEIAGAIDLAGVNDVSSEGMAGEEGPDFDRALDGWDRERRPVVLLAHQPIAVDESAARGVDLQLSGHTHGGQMFPFHGLVRLEQPYLAGLHRVDDTQVFVTNGAGFWGPPVRVGAPPEIAVVRLTAAP